jgi:hypothetical protein
VRSTRFRWRQRHEQRLPDGQRRLELQQNDVVFSTDLDDCPPLSF